MNGGSLFVNADNIIIANSQFDTNRALSSGGAIGSNRSISLIISNCSFTNS